MTANLGRCLTARAGRPTARAMLRCLGYSATIAIASCKMENQQAYDARMKLEDQREEYRSCLYEATGPFGSASIEIVRDCRERVYGSPNHQNMKGEARDPR